jgi:hypothetical protein
MIKAEVKNKKLIGCSYSSLHYFEPCNEEDCFRIKPKNSPLLSLTILALFFLIFGGIASLELYYYKPDSGTKAFIPLGLSIFTAVISILYTIITYYLEQKKGDILMYDKTLKLVKLPRLHIKLPFENTCIEIVRGKTKNKDLVAEIHLVDKTKKKRYLLMTRFASRKADFSDIITAIQENTPIVINKF